jgi:hypothetical protein
MGASISQQASTRILLEPHSEDFATIDRRIKLIPIQTLSKNWRRLFLTN